MSHRLLFLSPDLQTPSGGVAVIYDAAGITRAKGHEVAIVHDTPRGGYIGRERFEPTYFDQAIANQFRRSQGSLNSTVKLVKLRIDRMKFGPNEPLDLRPDDVFVVPEFMLAEACAAFPDNKQIVFVQNSFEFVRSLIRAKDRGFDLERIVLGLISISESCDEAILLAGFEEPLRVRVCPQFKHFQFSEAKQHIMAFMPRKRPEQARFVVDALRARNNIGDFVIKEIDGLSQSDVGTILRDSLVFLSFMKEEALGFPAMEAMSSGALVVGFDGFGTREYFNEKTGVPVAENDLMGFVEAAEAVAARAISDRAGVDALRRAGSEAIHRRYGGDTFSKDWGKAIEKLTARLV